MSPQLMIMKSDLRRLRCLCGLNGHWFLGAGRIWAVSNRTLRRLHSVSVLDTFDEDLSQHPALNLILQRALIHLTTMHIWTARIRCAEHELKCSFSVIIFLGNVPENPSQWHRSSTCAGEHEVLVNQNKGHGEDSIIEGFVHLNDGIESLLGLSSLEPDVVVPALKHNLQWRVLQVDVVSMCHRSYLLITYRSTVWSHIRNHSKL